MKIVSRLLVIFLVAIAAFVGIVYTLSDAETVNTTFTYQRATEREDGTPLLLEEIKYTRLFCDGELSAQEDGADGDIAAELPAGSHVCYGTHVDTDGLESRPSDPVTKLVEP